MRTSHAAFAAWVILGMLRAQQMHSGAGSPGCGPACGTSDPSMRSPAVAGKLLQMRIPPMQEPGQAHCPLAMECTVALRQRPESPDAAAGLPKHVLGPKPGSCPQEGQT